MPTSARTRTRRRHLLAAAALALVALVALPVVAAAAEPGTVRLLGTEPHRSVTVTTPTGARVTTVPSRLTLRVRAAAGAVVETGGFCADIHHYIGQGTDYEISLRTAADDPVLATPRYAEAGWLAHEAGAIIAAAPAAGRGLEAGAVQTAVWQLTGQARETAPTDDPALNARTAAIRALAAGRALGGPVSLSADAPRRCSGGAVRLRLTGVPGSSADLAATGAGGVVSPARVRFGADGRATAEVSSAQAGAVTVTARSVAAATLVRAARASAGRTTPQETVFAVRAAEAPTATATVTFDDCGLAPFEGGGPAKPDPSAPGADPAPLEPSAPAGPAPGALVPFAVPGTPSATPPGDEVRVRVPRPRRATAARRTLTIRKSAPARARAGARLRYTIRIANRGRAALRRVSVSDALPAGMSLLAVPARAALRGGRVVWSLGGLRPGASRTLRLTVRIDPDASGRVCNRARVSAAGARAAAAAACTRVRGVRRTTAPAVTS